MKTIQELEANGMSPEDAAVEAALNHEKVMGNIPSGSAGILHLHSVVCRICFCVKSEALLVD